MTNTVSEQLRFPTIAGMSVRFDGGTCLQMRDKRQTSRLCRPATQSSQCCHANRHTMFHLF